MSLGDVLNLRVGDVLPISVPEILSAKVDGTPVMECRYGIFNDQYALKVEKLLSSSAQEMAMDAAIVDNKPGNKQGANHG